MIIVSLSVRQSRNMKSGLILVNWGKCTSPHLIFLIHLKVYNWMPLASEPNGMYDHSYVITTDITDITTDITTVITTDIVADIVTDNLTNLQLILQLLFQLILQLIFQLIVTLYLS